MKSRQFKVVEESRSIIDWLADGCKQLIGKKAYYRPVGCREILEVNIVSSRTLVNLAGDKETLLKTDQGYEDADTAFYFDFPMDSASS